MALVSEEAVEKLLVQSTSIHWRCRSFEVQGKPLPLPNSFGDTVPSILSLKIRDKAVQLAFGRTPYVAHGWLAPETPPLPKTVLPAACLASGPSAVDTPLLPDWQSGVLNVPRAQPQSSCTEN